MKSKKTILKNLLKGKLSKKDKTALFNNPSFVEKQRQEWDESADLNYADEADGQKILTAIQSVIWKKSRNIPLYTKLYSAAACLLALVFLGGGIWFYDKGRKTDIERTYIVINGRQNIESIRLEDGTIVSLGAGSRLEYPMEFKGNRRLVKLYGQAFFRVMKNPRKPFTVKTSRFDVTAIGTAFEVFSFGKNERAETVLLNGKVKVETSSLSKNKQVKYILTPNHKISFDRNDQAKIEYINADSYSAWRNGNGLKFVNEKLSVIIPRLKKWYGVNNIICDNEVGNNYRFSFSIDSETLGEVMNILDRISPLSVKKERNIYVIER